VHKALLYHRHMYAEKTIEYVRWMNNILFWIRHITFLA